MGTLHHQPATSPVKKIQKIQGGVVRFQPTPWPCGSVSKPCTLVNIKIAGKWMFIPLKMVLIGIDPYPCFGSLIQDALNCAAGSALFDRWHHPDAGASVLHARSQAGAGVQAGLSATSWGKRRSRCLRNLHVHKLPCAIRCVTWYGYTMLCNCIHVVNAMMINW